MCDPLSASTTIVAGRATKGILLLSHVSTEEASIDFETIQLYQSSFRRLRIFKVDVSEASWSAGLFVYCQPYLQEQIRTYDVVYHTLYEVLSNIPWQVSKEYRMISVHISLERSPLKAFSSFWLLRTFFLPTGGINTNRSVEELYTIQFLDSPESLIGTVEINVAEPSWTT
jgi:hypothetical protein